MLQVGQDKDTFLADLAVLEERTTDMPAWLRALRQAARGRFAEISFPTTKDEDWRFTSVAPILRAGFHTDLDSEPPRLTLRAPRLSLDERVFFNARGSSTGDGWRADGGVSAALEAHLGRYAVDGSAFAVLNTAAIRDVAVVYVRAGEVERTVGLRFVSAAGPAGAASHPRVLIVLEPGASATVVESYESLDDGVTLSNAVTEIVLGVGSHLEHYKLLRENQQSFHVGLTQVHQERDSVFTSFSVALGNQLARNDLQVVLAGEGAECYLNGLYVTVGMQHVDNHTAIDHRGRHGTSRQLYKGILHGQSRAVFNGKILVRPGAHGTDAQQTNRNLILSGAALVDTKPQLEILDDDVRCSHGATIGQLDPNQIFYLKSRGLDARRARALLTRAFAAEVTGRMTLTSIRAEFDELMRNGGEE